MALTKAVLMSEYGMSEEKAQALLDKQEAEARELARKEAAAKVAKATVQVSTDSGWVCVRGLSRRPTTMHPEALRAILGELRERCTEVLARIDAKTLLPEDQFTPKPWVNSK